MGGLLKEVTDVRVFVPPSFEGVMSVVVLEEILKEGTTLDVQYTSSLDFREYIHSDLTDSTTSIFLGLPYRGYALPDDFYIMNDVPFSDFIHISTYGEQIKGDHIVSLVEPEKDPIKVLYQAIQNNPSSFILSDVVELTDKAYYFVEAVNAYRTWSWENNDTTRMLLALYHASYKRLPNLVRGLSLQEVVRRYAPIIKGQMEKMDDYINRKIATSREVYVDIEGQSCILKVVYADEYINEVANRLLQPQAPTPTIACVGRATKGGDIFSIRTDKVDAGKVAYLLNGGGGKDTVASVFSGVSYAELMSNSFKVRLDEAYI